MALDRNNFVSLKKLLHFSGKTHVTPSVLMRAVCNTHLESVRALVEAGVDVTKPAPCPVFCKVPLISPLHAALKLEYLTNAIFLFDSGASLPLQGDKNDWLPEVFIAVCASGHPSSSIAISKIVSSRSDIVNTICIHQFDSQRYYPLEFATNHNMLPVVKLLLHYGALPDKSATGKSSDFPLSVCVLNQQIGKNYCAATDRADIACLLLSSHATVPASLTKKFQLYIRQYPKVGAAFEHRWWLKTAITLLLSLHVRCGSNSKLSVLSQPLLRDIIEICREFVHFLIV